MSREVNQVTSRAFSRRDMLAVTATSLSFSLLGASIVRNSAVGQEPTARPELSADQQIRRDLFIRSAHTQMREKPETVLIALEAMEVAKAHPEISGIKILLRMTESQSKFDALRARANFRGEVFGPNRYIDAALQIAEKLPLSKYNMAIQGFSTSDKLLRSKLESNKATEKIRVLERIVGQRDLNRALSAIHEIDIDKALGEIWDMANMDEDFSEASSAYLQNAIHVAPNQSSSELLSDQNAIGQVAAASKTLSPEIMKQIREIAERAAKDQQMSPADQKVLQDLLHNELKKGFEGLREDIAIALQHQQEQALAQQRYQDYNHELQAVIAVAGAVTSLMRAFGGKQAHEDAAQIDLMIDTGSKIAMAYAICLVAPEVGAVIMAATMVKTFADFCDESKQLQQKMGEATINGINMILDQLLLIRKEMYEYYKSLGHKIDNLENTVVDGFNKVFRVLTDQSRTLDEIRREVSRIHLTLNEMREEQRAMERRLSSELRAGFERQLFEAEEFYLRHPYRFRDEMSLDKWKDGLTVFKAHALRDSEDALALAHPVTELNQISNSEMYRSLSERPLPFHFDLLIKIAPAMFKSGVISDHEKLANPGYWITGAQSYLSLVDSNPQHRHVLKDLDFQELIAEGEAILNALANIKVVKSPPEETTPEPLKIRLDLFTTLLENYKKEAGRFSDLITKISRDFGKRRMAGFDPIARNFEGLPTLELQDKINLINKPKKADQMPLPTIAHDLTPAEVTRYLAFHKQNGLDMPKFEWAYDLDWYVNTKVGPVEGGIGPNHPAVLVYTLRSDLDGMGMVSFSEYYASGYMSDGKDKPVYGFRKKEGGNEFEQVELYKLSSRDARDERQESILTSREIIDDDTKIHERSRKWVLFKTKEAKKTHEKVADKLQGLVDARYIDFQKECSAALLAMHSGVDFSCSLLEESEVTDLKEGMRSLWGAKMLFDAYISLGVPSSNRVDSELGKFFREHPLKGRDEIVELLTNHSSNFSEIFVGDNSQVDKCVNETEEGVNTLIGKRVDGLLEESFPVVEDLLANLKVAQILAQSKGD